MYLYENALIKDINNIFINSKVTTIISDSIDTALKRIAAKNEDTVTLPLIVLVSRDWEIGDTNFYSYMKGITNKTKLIKDNDEQHTLIKATNVIPFTPTYTFYIVCSSSRECDMLTREIIFHYYMQPTLTVDIPYGIDKSHTFNINFDKRITKDQTYSGLVYRTINFNLAGAYLWHNNTIATLDEVNLSIDERYENNVKNNQY